MQAGAHFMTTYDAAAGREMAIGSSHEDVDFESASESQTLRRGASMAADPIQPFVIDLPAMLAGRPGHHHSARY